MGFQTMDLDSDHHPLLEQQPPKYSNLTIRRAYIVWLRTGQRNEFKHVCDYYHRLEELEKNLPEYTRAISRHHEFSLFITDPPTSPYQMSLFPNLYSAPHRLNYPVYNQVYIKPQPIYQIPKQPVVIEEINQPVVPAKVEGRKTPEVSLDQIFEASQVFKTPEEPVVNDRIAAELDIRVIKFPKRSQNINKHTTNESIEQTIDKSNKETETEGVPKKDILKTIHLVNNYCKGQQLPVRNFWNNFNEYASRCELSNSVYNVSSYIRNKMIQYELPMALFELKVKSIERIKKSPPKFEYETNDAFLNETQDSPTTSCESDEEEIEFNGYTEIEMENIRKVNEFNEDLISFVDKITREQEEKIKKFFEEASLGFSNADDNDHDQVSKCREI